jgi:hypothetical protein
VTIGEQGGQLDTPQAQLHHSRTQGRGIARRRRGQRSRGRRGCRERDRTVIEPVVCTHKQTIRGAKAQGPHFNTHRVPNRGNGFPVVRTPQPNLAVGRTGNQRTGTDLGVASKSRHIPTGATRHKAPLRTIPGPNTIARTHPEVLTIRPVVHYLSHAPLEIAQTLPMETPKYKDTRTFQAGKDSATSVHENCNRPVGNFIGRQPLFGKRLPAVGTWIEDIALVFYIYSIDGRRSATRTRHVANIGMAGIDTIVEGLPDSAVRYRAIYSIAPGTRQPVIATPDDGQDIAISIKTLIRFAPVGSAIIGTHNTWGHHITRRDWMLWFTSAHQYELPQWIDGLDSQAGQHYRFGKASEDMLVPKEQWEQNHDGCKKEPSHRASLHMHQCFPGVGPMGVPPPPPPPPLLFAA